MLCPRHDYDVPGSRLARRSLLIRVESVEDDVPDISYLIVLPGVQ